MVPSACFALVNDSLEQQALEVLPVFGGGGTNELPIRQWQVSTLAVATTLQQLCSLCVGLDRLVLLKEGVHLFLGEGLWTLLALDRQLQRVDGRVTGLEKCLA